MKTIKNIIQKFILIEFANGRINTQAATDDMINLIQKRLGMGNAEAKDFLRESIGLSKLYSL